MAERPSAIGLYFAHVVAQALGPRLPPGARVVDFGDRSSPVAPHLEAAGASVVSHLEEGPFQGAFAWVAEWDRVRARAREVTERLAPGAPLVVRLARRRGVRAARVSSDLGAAVAFTGRSALGLVVPGEEWSGWAERHPQVFAACCALEGALRACAPFRRGGRETLLTGVRRGARG
jgi:hypothetical protein